MQSKDLFENEVCYCLLKREILFPFTNKHVSENNPPFEKNVNKMEDILFDHLSLSIAHEQHLCSTALQIQVEVVVLP